MDFLLVSYMATSQSNVFNLIVYVIMSMVDELNPNILNKLNAALLMCVLDKMQVTTFTV